MNGPQEFPQDDPSDDNKEGRLPLGKRLRWLDDLTSGIHGGSTTLLAGTPSGGKSRLANQIALATAAGGLKSLTIMSEESPERLDRRLALMTSGWPRREAARALELVQRTDEVMDLEQLPGFLVHHVLSTQGRYAGTKLLFLDSIQGDGVSANAARKYAAYYEYCRLAKRNGITTVGIGQITKRNQLAGPRGLEHFVDVVIRIEKVAHYRICACVKNRFAMDNPRGIPLVIDPTTINLVPSPHREPVTGSCRTFLGAGVGAFEIQAAVSLPMPGSRPQIVAPGLPRDRVQQIVTAISKMDLLKLDQLDLSISALLPGDATFRSWLGLPLAIALIGSCIRRSVPRDLVLAGEVDLSRDLRPLPPAVSDAMAVELSEGRFGDRVRVIVPRSGEPLPAGGGRQVITCATLDEVVPHVWPEL
jgi:DNA repair protein RadA/Sms